MNIFLIVLGKAISRMFRLLNLGNGSTWPGHIALNVNKHFISDLLKKSSMQIIMVAGTNGKTTTSSLIKHLLEANGKKVLLNKSGANLLNGIASTLLLNSTLTGRLTYDFAIFEIDENVLPHILKQVTPDYLVLLNLFRDQLDRYGEVHTIADKWEHAITTLFSRHPGVGAPSQSEKYSWGEDHDRIKIPNLILNADDPEIAWLGLQQEYSSSNARSSHDVRNDKTRYFGLEDKSLHKEVRDHAVDSVYCPRCNFPLEYITNYYSHLGDWYCPDCKLARPKPDIAASPNYPLSGTYNQYNTHAAILVAKQIKISKETIDAALQDFTPAFGRQEILEIDGKKVQIFLSKNPISFNQSLETITSLGGKNLLLVLNDKVADGHDVSWIWDTNLEQHLKQFTNLIMSGDRCFDLGLRVKYAQDSSKIPDTTYQILPELPQAIHHALEKIKQNETLYILPTYTAMLEVRKILTGKKIL